MPVAAISASRARTVAAASVARACVACQRLPEIIPSSCKLRSRASACRARFACERASVSARPASNNCGLAKVASGWPARTGWPIATSTRETIPGYGAATTYCASGLSTTRPLAPISSWAAALTGLNRTPSDWIWAADRTKACAHARLWANSVDATSVPTTRLLG